MNYYYMISFYHRYDTKWPLRNNITEKTDFWEQWTHASKKKGFVYIHVNIDVHYNQDASH